MKKQTTYKWRKIHNTNEFKELSELLRKNHKTLIGKMLLIFFLKFGYQMPDEIIKKLFNFKSEIEYRNIILQGIDFYKGIESFPPEYVAQAEKIGLTEKINNLKGIL